MEAKFSLQELFKREFGFAGTRIAVKNLDKAFPSKRDVANFDDKEFSLIQLPVEKATSIVGTPIYELFTFELPSGERYTLPDWPLMVLRRAKKIVTTTIQGGDGDVIEIIGKGNWEISIYGFIINYESYEYPKQQVKELNDFFNIDQQINVFSEVLNELDIYSVVVRELSLPAEQGFNNVQAFQLDLFSDKNIELVITEA
jgi:hypothetical protein